jgi:hypothetical protein
MIECDENDLAVVKALSKSALTLEEIESLLDADNKYFMVDQGLDHVQTSAVKSWAKSEALRCKAQLQQQGQSLEEMGLDEGLEGLGKILTEEDLGRLLDYGEVKSDSDEGHMAKQDLYKMSEYSAKLHDMLDDNDDLPEWCLKYIYLSSAALSKVYHHLEYKISQGVSSNN